MRFHAAIADLPDERFGVVATVGTNSLRQQPAVVQFVELLLRHFRLDRLQCAAHIQQHALSVAVSHGSVPVLRSCARSARLG
jgi:hypothetical protein